MIKAFFLALLAVMVATPLQAGGADDVKAGLEALREGAHDRAIQLLSRALETGGLTTDEQVTAAKARGAGYQARSLIADTFERGEEARQLREKALADYDAVLRLAPEDEETLVDRGQIFQADRHYERALADYAAALRLKRSPATLMLQAASFRAIGDTDRAIADYTAVLDLGAGDSGLAPWDIHTERAFAAFLAGRYAAAAADFETALRLGASAHTEDVLWIPYQAAWLHIARARAGENDAAELASNAARVKLDQWPGTLLALFLGRIEPAAIAAPTSHSAMSIGRRRECNVAFFLGQAALIAGDTATAQRQLSQARSACSPQAVTFLAADADLKRMTQ
jgi:tetratricopeptide (TPR) repeat protein